MAQVRWSFRVSVESSVETARGTARAWAAAIALAREGPTLQFSTNVTVLMVFPDSAEPKQGQHRAVHQTERTSSV
jgi:hypothetical protein